MASLKLRAFIQTHFILWASPGGIMEHSLWYPRHWAQYVRSWFWTQFIEWINMMRNSLSRYLSGLNVETREVISFSGKAGSGEKAISGLGMWKTLILYTDFRANGGRCFKEVFGYFLLKDIYWASIEGWKVGIALNWNGSGVPSLVGKTDKSAGNYNTVWQMGEV